MRKQVARVSAISNEVRAAGVTDAEFLQRLEQNEQLFDLLFRVLEGARRTASEEKRRLFGRLFVDGFKDDARVDLDLRFSEALDVLDPPEVGLLHVILEASTVVPQGKGEPFGISPHQLPERLGQSSHAIASSLSRLIRSGLIKHEFSNALRAPSDGVLWVSDFGREFLLFLEAPPD